MDKLYFGDLFVGEILHLGNDFPWFHGKFLPHMDSADGTSVHITKYITFSIRQSNFYMEQTESDPLQDIENELLKEEPAFNDLINSGQWRIINDKAEITKILIPVFHSDGGIGWRLA